MISIQGVTFTYPGGATPVLRDLELEIPQGAFVALVGNNGSGKTSLCKLLTGLIPHFFEGDFVGTVHVDGLNTLETRVAELSKHVGYVYQDFENQLLKPKVIDDVAFAPLNFGMLDYRERAAAILDTLGLSYLQERIIWELSGGEQHLIALAGALVLEPSIIVVDEPVSQLDPVNAEKIYNILAFLNKELGKTVIVIEHFSDFIGAYCDSVILMKQGTVVWHLPVREAYARIDELAENNIYSPQVTQIAYHSKSKIGAAADFPINLEEGAAYFKPYTVGHSVHRPHSSLGSTTTPNEPVVQFQHVSHHYKLLDDSLKRALQNVDLTFHNGERIALVGANGAGKSTMMRLICGLETPKEGRVHVLGVDTQTTSPERLADHVAFVYQHPQQMFIEDNVRGDVAYFLKARRMADTDEIVNKAIKDFDLIEIEDRDGRLLSGGQMRRASLAIGACMRPAVMLLDEPTASLDMASRRHISRMLERLQAWVKTVVIATHDMELVAEWASRVIVVKDGQILTDDTPKNLFSNRQLIYEATIRPPQVVQLSHALDIKPVHLSVESFVTELGRSTDEST